MGGAGKGYGLSPGMIYNKEQWVSSFEDAILRLRPHLTTRVLATITAMAWPRYGVKGQDPKSAVDDWLESSKK